jgi:polyphenol oxidase
MNSSLLHQTNNGLSYYQYTRFTAFPGLIHGIFTRHGGLSRGPYQSLNLSSSVGDDPEKVAGNRALIQRGLGLDRLKSLDQVHGKEMVIVEDGGEGEAASAADSGDILMTRLPGQGLMIKQADCQSVVLFDPRHRAVANVHCGWRGNVLNVLGEAVKGMMAAYGSRPAELMAGIGPSLGPCCAQFVNYEREIPRPYWKYQIRPFYFDLWQLSRDQLIEAGLPEDHIDISGICTSCQTEDFFSYRKEKTTGRFVTVIALQ